MSHGYDGFLERARAAMAAAAVLLAAGACLEAQQPPAATAQERVEGPIGKSIDAHLGRLVPFGLSGAALVSIGGETVLARGYGLAVDQPPSPCTIDTAFPLDSISKHFTAAAILKLQMQGRLDVDDRLDEYFPELPEDKRGITLHQLLTHTSGLIAGTTVHFDPCTREGVLDEIFAAPLQFEPGTADGYSNLGYSTLAAIIEQVSEQSLDDFMREHLFEPAGMTRSGLLPARLLRGPVAHRYAGGRDHGGPQAGEFPDWNVYGGSGVYATVTDMLRWSEALRGEALLSAEAKAAMETPVLNDFGYGVSIEQTEHGRLLRNHGGSSSGSASAFLRYEQDDVTFVLLLNRDGEMFGDAGLGGQLEELLWGASVPLPPAARALEAEFAEANAGDFRFENGAEVRLTYTDGRLELHGSNQTAVNAFMGVSDAPALDATTERAKELLQAWLADPELPRLNVALRRHLAAVREETAQEAGAFRRFEVLGSTPDWLGDTVPTGAMTIARMVFERDTRVFRIHWSEGMVTALGGDRLAEPCNTWCLPADDDPDVLVAYHLPTGAQPRLRIGRDDDGRIVRIEGAGGLIASRITARKP